jgi:peptide/nickel transport system permease protein
LSRFILQRLLHAVPVLVGISIVSFGLIHLVPGDPVRIMLGTRASSEAATQLRHQFALDQPLPAQYLHFVRGVFTLNFGDSVVLHQSVGSLIAGRIGASLLLIAYAALISIVIAVPLALIAARRRNRPVDHGIRVLTMVTFAMPTFWLGLLLVEAFSLRLRWLPSSGYETGFVGYLRSLTLPALTVGLYLAPLLLRQLRSSIIETLASEHVESARARGLSSRRVLTRHVLRNSLVATVTVLAVSVGFLLSGTVVVETVFAVPGLGSLLVSSVIARDFPVIQALTLVFGVAVIAINLAADALYAALDPRVRL